MTHLTNLWLHYQIVAIKHARRKNDGAKYPNLETFNQLYICPGEAEAYLQAEPAEALQYILDDFLLAFNIMDRTADGLALLVSSLCQAAVQELPGVSAPPHMSSSGTASQIEATVALCTLVTAFEHKDFGQAPVFPGPSCFSIPGAFPIERERNGDWWDGWVEVEKSMCMNIKTIFAVQTWSQAYTGSPCVRQIDQQHNFVNVVEAQNSDKVSFAWLVFHDRVRQHPFKMEICLGLQVRNWTPFESTLRKSWKPSPSRQLQISPHPLKAWSACKQLDMPS